MLVMNCYGTALLEATQMKVYPTLDNKWSIVVSSGEKVSRDYDSQEEASNALIGYYGSTAMYFYNEKQ
jgi:hypothetical protein